MELWLPYGQTEIPVRVPDDNFYRIVEPAKPTSPKTVGSLVEEAIANPVGGLALESLVKPGSHVGIITDPMIPSEERLETSGALKSCLNALGIDKITTFLRHRMSTTTTTDSAKLLDPGQNSFTEIGKTTMGTTVDLDPELASCDLKIMVSLGVPHFATGFSGGCDTIIPSCSSLRSISKNRSLLVKGFPEPLKSGENLLLSDSLEACSLGGPIYSLSLLPDGWGGVAEVYAGEVTPVLSKSLERYSELHAPRIERKLEIVIVSAGAMLGNDLYHAIRVVSNVLGAVKKDGTVILVGECSGGIGDQAFLYYARKFSDRKELSTELRHRFKLGGHVSLYVKEILDRCRIQLVSVLPELFVRDTFGLKPSQTATEAVQKAIRVEGRESKILIVPHGQFTVPRMDSITV